MENVVWRWIMELLRYTRKLYDKIKFYDKYFQYNNFESLINNPFFKLKPFEVTVIFESEPK